MAGEAILVVDDNPQNLKLARVLLSGEGYSVRTATDAEEALRILDAFSPRLVRHDMPIVEFAHVSEGHHHQDEAQRGIRLCSPRVCGGRREIT
jgi:CheY-like chemotaxis protein